MTLDLEIDEYLKKFKFKDNITLLDYSESKDSTVVEDVNLNSHTIKRYINEFWTSKQRQASSLHEISYRACFKPQLPRFFIKLLTKEKDWIYDPFSGRGTTVIEAGLLNRNAIANDVNPLSKILTKPRFFIPSLNEIKQRLSEIPFLEGSKAEMDLSMFYHPDTESEIVSIKNYLYKRAQQGQEDHIDQWIRMVATNRLTGHSKGFFSVYTLPPNQAVYPDRQIKINIKLNQKPEYRNTKEIIVRKSASLLSDVTDNQRATLKEIGNSAKFLTTDARETYEIPSESVSLTVTSPPFLDIVDYNQDNWLRCWFNSINCKDIEKRITISRTIDAWSNVMGDAFKEFYRITKPGGWVAFEVGEIRKGKLKLDEYVVPLGLNAGFECKGIVVNLQEFTKTSNIWGVNNMKIGTNTNRIVLFSKS